MALRIVLLGFGSIGQVHAKVLALDRRVELAGVVEPDPGRREQFRWLYGGGQFHNLEDALAARPDAVFVTSPNVHHTAAVLESLDRGVAVFCEKPLATSVADAHRIRDAARRSGALLQVGHNRRFAPAYRFCRRVVEEGLKPFSASIIKNDPDLHSPAWSADPAVTGGLLFNGTIHALDAALWLLGPAQQVFCAARSGCYPDLDNLAITLRFASGAVANVSTCGHASRLVPLERVAIYGDHASVVLEDPERVAFAPGPNQPIVVEDFRQLPFEQRWGYQDQDRAFVDALSGQGPVAVGVEEGCRVIELIDACYRSARESRPVALG